MKREPGQPYKWPEYSLGGTQLLVHGPCVIGEFELASPLGLVDFKVSLYLPCDHGVRTDVFNSLLSQETKAKLEIPTFPTPLPRYESLRSQSL